MANGYCTGQHRIFILLKKVLFGTTALDNYDCLCYVKKEDIFGALLLKIDYFLTWVKSRFEVDSARGREIKSEAMLLFRRDLKNH